MKKNIFTVVFRSISVIFLFADLSCSPFEPVTDVGKDVVSSIDSNATNLKNGFKVLNGINLAVSGARNVTSLFPDTSMSGVHSLYFSAGSIVNEHAIAYTELHTIGTHTDGVYQRLVTSPDSTVFKAYLEIYYYPQYSDTNNNVAGGSTIRFSVYSCHVKYPTGSLIDTNPANATALDTFTINSKIADTINVPLDSTSMALIDKAIRNTSSDSTTYDTCGYYIKPLDAGALFRFSVPFVKMHFKTSKTDTAAHDSATIACPYFDMSVFDTVVADSSLVASWEADRFIEIPISLKPLWDSVTSAGSVGNFKIVQAASCVLFTGTSVFEKADTADIARSFVYGLLDHTITDSKMHAIGTRDSLINAGLSAADTVRTSPTKISLFMTRFLQSLADEKPRPDTAYLYLFARPVSHFGRVVLQNMQTIKFSALFSNSHK